MNVEKTKAKLPTLTEKELATLATMVADEQRKRKIKVGNRRDYTLHREKRMFVSTKSVFTPQQEKWKNQMVRETHHPVTSVDYFEQVFNKHHPGGSMMEDDLTGFDENEY